MRFGSNRSTFDKVARGFEALVGAVLIASAAMKGFELSLFTVQIAGYRMLPAALEFPAAAGIVLAEAVLGAALIAGVGRAWPHVLTIVLLAGFSGVFVYGLLARGITECGCFGDFLKLPPAVTLGKNVVLVAMLVVAIAGRRREKWKKARVAAAAALFAVACGALAIGAYRHVSEQRAMNAAVSGPVDAARPYARFVLNEANQKYDLGRGEYLVVWLSTTCPECKKAVAQIGELRQMIPGMPQVIGLCLGDRPTLEKFRAETKPTFPTTLVPARVFTEFVDVEPPRYVLVRDGAAIAQWDTQLPAMALMEKLGGM